MQLQEIKMAHANEAIWSVRTTFGKTARELHKTLFTSHAAGRLVDITGVSKFCDALLAAPNKERQVVRSAIAYLTGPDAELDQLLREGDFPSVAKLRAALLAHDNIGDVVAADVLGMLVDSYPSSASVTDFPARFLRWHVGVKEWEALVSASAEGNGTGELAFNPVIDQGGALLMTVMRGRTLQSVWNTFFEPLITAGIAWPSWDLVERVLLNCERKQVWNFERSHAPDNVHPHARAHKSKNKSGAQHSVSRQLQEGLRSIAKASQETMDRAVASIRQDIGRESSDGFEQAARQLTMEVSALVAQRTGSGTARQQKNSSGAVCYNFQDKGSCRFGEGCRFAHQGGNRRPRPSAQASVACRDFARGRCSRSRCRFMHQEQNPGHRPRSRPRPCFTFQNTGFCAKTTCRFEHDPDQRGGGGRSDDAGGICQAYRRGACGPSAPCGLRHVGVPRQAGKETVAAAVVNGHVHADRQGNITENGEQSGSDEQSNWDGQAANSQSSAR
jgi:hypothetical protein